MAELLSGKTIMIWGPPGSGKSTLSGMLKENIPNYKQFSVRGYANFVESEKTELGKQIKEFKKTGKMLLPIYIVRELFADFIRNSHKDDFILIEGFPINEEQNNIMIEILGKVERVINSIIYLFAELDVLKKRIGGRLVCAYCEAKNKAGIAIEPNNYYCPFCGKRLEKRFDDQTDIFMERFRLHEKEISILSYLYEDQLIHRFNTGIIEMKDILKEVKNTLLGIPT